MQQDGDVVVSRGWRRKGDARRRVIVVAPAADPPAPSTLERLDHEYGLKDELDGGWAAQPLELARERGRTLLVLADPDGVPLAQLLGRPMDTARFLRLAIGLAAAVSQVHRRGLIHKDIRPANVLVDEASGAVHLMGFGQASRLPRETVAPMPPAPFAGALPYMAPEQTGRMNRSVDTRSDLYAVGVTLYEMLTGGLPFSAAEPLEWVHCHIARLPKPPVERLPSVPSAISAIVMKCLAKTAEDRYQTAAGLRADLERCLDEWEATGRISPFRPGGQDVPDVLRIPERLYGREREVAALLEAFDRVVADRGPELVLVSGYSGVGKSSMVNELHKALVPPRSLFATGKFDQYKRDIPYSTLAQAFQGLIRPLLGKSESELARWRDELVAALAPNGALMVALVPDLKLITGEQPPVPDLPPQEAEHRFRHVVRRFIGVFARPEHPLALFLDDLQWLDPATLALLTDLALQSDVRSLLLIGAFRDNEVDSTHPLMRSLDAIHEAGGRVQNIVLSPLAREDVGRLLADALHCTQKAAEPLTGLVYDKTGGNPFFTIQFLTALAGEKLIAFDPMAGGWTWDLNRIRAKGYTDNVVDLMVGKLARLPKETQGALQWLAALGHRADFATLSLVLGGSVEEIHAALWEAVRAGLVLRQKEAYAFLHDRVQEAGYSLIPEASRAKTHLDIGRALASRLSPEEIAERIFEVVSQLNRGSALVDTPEERAHIAELDLLAGKRAKVSTAYASALAYLAAGAELLADDRWSRCYDLAFPLELNRAECEFLTGDLKAAEQRLAALWTRAAGTVDRAAVTCLRIMLYTTMARCDLSVEACLAYLRKVGVHWTPHPAEDEVREEYGAIWRRIGERPIEALIDLPPMGDPKRRATLDVLKWVLDCALFTDQNLFRMVVGRMVNLSLEHGNSDGSSFGYIWVGLVVMDWLGDYSAGFSFGKLGMDLVEKAGLARFKAEAYLTFGVHIVPWVRHVREGMDLIRRARALAHETGNLNWEAYASVRLISGQLVAGLPLAEVQNEAERALEFSRKAKFGIVVDLVTSERQLVRTLRGLTPALGSFEEADFNEGRFEAHLGVNPSLALALCLYWVHKLQAYVFSGDFAAASAAAAKARGLLWTSLSFAEVGEYHFYAALACAGGYDATPTTERDHQLAALCAHRDQLAAWAEVCPDNFDTRAALIGAEIARIEGRDLEAMRLYEQAIQSARDNGFVHIEALAYEWAGRFYLDRSLKTAGLGHMRNALAAFTLWGAEGKVRQLNQLYPQLAASEAAPRAIGSAFAQLDVASLIKASQAVSSELEPARLIQTLMAITLQNSGADRGLLLLAEGGALKVEAEARAGAAGVEVQIRRSTLTAEDAPEAVINLVMRTHESCLLEDGSRPDPAWENVFGGAAPPRSAFCLPLLRQGRLDGVLYLENSQAAYAFTAKRVAVLEVLTAQAAIALENARLFGELQESEARSGRLIDSNIIGVYTWTLDGRIVEANDAFLAIVGYDHGDLLSGRVGWAKMTPPEWQDADRRMIEQLEASGRLAPFEKEYFRKDGSRVQVLLGAAAFDETREKGIAFVLDLTERKQAEERLRIMVEELNHRVKNTLATVMTIASQTVRSAPSPEAFREAFQGRLKALAKTHDILNRTFWTGVRLRELVEEEVSPFAPGDEGRIELSGNDVVLGPIAAVTLGMAFHELAVNAAKYGAFSVPDGRVQVSWRTGEPGRLHLEWRESGGPPVRPPPRRGFGSKMIEQVLASELRGEVRLDFSPQGLCCNMDMALAHVSAH